MSAAGRVPAIVLGGSGYVAGELLRLLAAHPRLEAAAILSDSRPGEPVAAAFPHLIAAYPDARFHSLAEIEALVRRTPRSAVFSAAPHGVSAGLIDRVLGAAEAGGMQATCVDISADFRYSSAAEYERVYAHAHGAPARLAQFTCSVPEHLASPATAHLAHPGCFATAALLASVPLLARGLIEPELFVSGVTGSTGSGREPSAGTHHPLRHADLYSYGALRHRHAPEILACAERASGVRPQLHFVPHSGPFARGIHVTVQARLKAPIDADAALEALAGFYASSPFVRVAPAAPRLKDVVSSNYAHLGVATDSGSVAVFCAIDNLTKGAAGGAVQWMNRLLGFDERDGLRAPAPGWT
jgi:N-acetyl-gamma-glutamyl-phosphate reductase common form